MAYLRITFPYSWNYTYSDITLHAEQPGYDGQEQDWTQNQGQMSSTGFFPNMWINWDFQFTSSVFHNGDWQFTFNYQWHRWEMGHIVEEGDGCIEDRPFVVNNLVVTDAYDTATNSRNFVVVQDDEAPVIHAAITAHPYGDSRDTITYAVWLWNFGANPGQSGPWTVTKTLAGASDSMDIALDQAHSGNPKPARGVYAFDVQATAYTAYTSGVWCDGDPSVECDAVEVTGISSSTNDCTATADATYEIAVTNGSSAKFEFFGPTTSSPDISLRNTITGGTAVLGSNEKEGASLSIGVSDTHYLGVAILDNHPERYRSHTARWCIARGWTAHVPTVASLQHDSPGYVPYDNIDSELCARFGALKDPAAPSWWLYRGRWLSTGSDLVGACSDTGDIGKDSVIETLANSDVWIYRGHGGAGQILLDSSESEEARLSSGEVPDGHLQLALVLCCRGRLFTESIVTHNPGVFAVAAGMDWKVRIVSADTYAKLFTNELKKAYATRGVPVPLYALHGIVRGQLKQAGLYWNKTHPGVGYFFAYGSKTATLVPSHGQPMFTGGVSQ